MKDGYQSTALWGETRHSRCQGNEVWSADSLAHQAVGGSGTCSSVKKGESEENPGRTRRKETITVIHSSFFFFFFHFCARWNLLDLCAWRVLLGRERDILVDSHRQRVFVQGHAEKKQLINQLFALAMKPLNIQLYFKSISYEHNITPAYSLSITAARAQPSGDCYGSAHHISFVRR